MNETNSGTELSALTPNAAHFDDSSDETAQIPGPREYRIQDFWGDDPAVLRHSERMEVQPSPTQQVFPTPEPKPSWIQRLLIWLADPLSIAPIVPSEHLLGKTSARRTNL